MAKNKKNKAKTELSTPESTTQSTKTVHKRAFQGAIFNRLTSDWGSSESINLDLQQGLRTLRGRTRELSINNEFARRYLKLIKTNVVGPDGVQLSVQATYPDQSMDSMNDRIESHFDTWGRPENCTVTGRLDWRKVQELVIESVARDGEALVWLRRGPEFGKYAFQLQLLDADHLDENYNYTMPNGNAVFQGVELNSYGRPVAYHLWESNPSDTGLIGGQKPANRIRVSAEDLLHIFDTERASQVRGYPWLSSAMLALHHIGKYREAELIAARIAASKQMFYKQQENVGFGGDDDELDDQGNITFETNPGTHEILPRGWSIEHVDFSHPNTTFSQFQKDVLRGVAAGLGVSYNSLASDLESVNYSSARFGGLEDQAQFRSMQRWFINALIKPVYEEWLKIQLLTNNWGLSIPYNKFDKFNTVRYIARSWQSVDPAKDLRADVEALNNSLTSHSDVISKTGRDPEEVFAQIKKDKERMAAMGITPLDVQQQMKDLSGTEATASDAA